MKKKLLAILAHPDDESFGPGGTFAKYAAEGVELHIAIATDGAAGSVAEGFEEARAELASVRAEELKKAVDILGGKLYTLDYRDSGMTGDEANKHPDAFINADEFDAIGRVVKLIREIQPHVVVTHDETGGYFHPDHIMCWKIVTPAYHASGDEFQFTEYELPAWGPDRLFYVVRPKRWVKLFATILRLSGKDPTAMGRNKDIDLTKLGQESDDIHVRIDYRKYWDVKRRASREHASQGGGTSFFRFLPQFLQRQLFGYDHYQQAHPAVPRGYKDIDLFPF
ncbi:MAG: PIG-L family deacetylase [Chloroflexota bacterium]